MRRIDAHAHLWDPAERDYGWLDPTLGILHRRYDADQLCAANGVVGIDGAVIVQAAAAEEETRALLRVAAERRDVLGVVGWVDVETGDVGRALTRLRSAPGGEGLVGVRVNALPHAQRWLATPAVASRLAQIPAAGLALELIVDADRLSSVVRLAEALPEARIVIDHLAHPPARVREVPAWASALRALARFDKAFVKLSALVALRPIGSPVRPFLKRIGTTALAAFGPHRTMFGSDWPVCLASHSHHDVVTLAAELIAGLGRAEQGMVWSGAAEAAYGLRTQ